MEGLIYKLRNRSRPFPIIAAATVCPVILVFVHASVQFIWVPTAATTGTARPRIGSNFRHGQTLDYFQRRRSAVLKGVVAGHATVLLPAAQAASASTGSDGVPYSSVADTSCLKMLGSSQNKPNVAFPIWESTMEAGELTSLLQAADGGAATLGKPAADWPGLWRVVYAPHMKTLGGLALTRFDVYYDIAAVGEALKLRSHVRFEAPFGAGWLSAAGPVTTLERQLEVPGLGARPTTEVAFQEFWIDLGSSLPRSVPDASDSIIQSIAAPFFLKQFSIFPTLLFDARLGVCVFRFPLLGVEIAAQRVGPPGSKVRAPGA